MQINHQEASKKSVTDKVALIIVIAVLFTGINGLISILLLIGISRLNFGRDIEAKHGVSSGASRLGGLAVFFSLFIGVTINHYLSETLSIESLLLYVDDIFLFSFLIGLIGLIEDLSQRISSLIRLLLILFIVAISIATMHDQLPIDLIIFDQFEGVSKTVLVYLFTVIMVSGFVNAGNIADGANGLLSLIYIIFFLLLYSLDPSIFYLSMIVSLLIFFIYNVGTGRIFLGDFGSYFLSALAAYSSLKIYAERDVSVFLLASILIYPCFEISRSLITRFFGKVSLISPDNNHLHNYVNDYFLFLGFSSHKSNSLTGFAIASLTSFVPFYLFFIGVNPIGHFWLVLFLCEFFLLCIIYFLLTKINLKKM